MISIKATTAVLLTLLIVSTLSEEHQPLELDKPYPQELNETTLFTGRYLFAISDENIKKIQGDKWFFFVEVEPNESNEWVSTIIEISVGKKGEEESKNQRICGTRSGGIDSCYFTNKQFDYKTEEVHALVRCRGPCKFKISGEVSEPYKLKHGESVEMDFENTAYSKVFQIDTKEANDFDQLRIILKPKGFLQFGAPIGLYMNKGTSLPTRRSHDFSSITLWDNGEGIFIDTPEAKGVFTILVEGPQKNVLILENSLLSFKKSYQVSESTPYFDYLGEAAKKLYKCKVDPVIGLSLKLSTFSGAIKLNRILDAEMQEIDQQFPPLHHSYSDIEYQLPASFFKENDQYYKIKEYLIFEIEGAEESTFLIQYFPLSKGILHLVPQLKRYVELPTKTSNQYYIEIVEMNSPDFKKADIEVILTHETNKPVDIRFFKCDKQHGKECQLKKSELESTIIDSEGVKEVTENVKQNIEDGVVIYKFSFPSKFFKKINEDVKMYLLGVVVNNPADQERLYTIRYKNVGHNVYLKEMDIQKDRISIDEQRYYLFTNRQSDNKEIRAHLMEISGRVKIEGFYEDPRTKDLEGQQVTDFHNVVRFSNVKENQTVYLRVTGKETAYYSIQIQPMKETQRQWWNRTHGNRGRFYNQITIFEDIPYEFTLAPHERVVYQVHAKHQQFLLDMSSLLPLDLCMTEELTQPPFKPNCEVSEKLTKNELEQVQMERGTVGNIGVINNNDKTNKFHIKFYAVDKAPTNSSNSSKPSNSSEIKPSDDYSKAKCTPTMLGKVTKFSLKSATSVCYTYLITDIQDTEFTINVAGHSIDKINVVAALGNVQRIEILGQVHLFKQKQMVKACDNKVPCTLKIFVDSEVDADIMFTAQALNKVVFLLDGIANSFTGNLNRFFAYELINKVNTTIILENKNGNYDFFGKVVEANAYWNNSVVHPNSQSFVFKSVNPFYYNYQLYVLTENMIKETKCQECLLLLKVQRRDVSEYGTEKSKFSIECTQEDRLLKEDSPVASYLNKHSVAFYEIENQQEGTLIIAINSQNQQCANIFVKKGTNRATGSDFDYSSAHSHILFIEKAEKTHYSVTVQAIDDCYYSVDYTLATNKIYSTIEPGMYTDVRLDKSEQYRLVYHHTINKGFRVVTLHQSGEIVLKMKKYKNITDFIEDKSSNKKYTWSGRDFLRIEQQDSNFCYDCYYLISLSAERQTKTSIIIPTETSEFPIMIDSVMKQELKKGEEQKMRVYTQNIVQFQINVQYGSVNVSLQTEQNSKEFLFTKIYKANEKTQFEAINGSKEEASKQYSFMTYTKVIVKAEEDSGFSFALVSDKDASKRGSRVKYGIPEYITVEANKEECLSGRLDDNEQQFLVSITGEKQVDLMNNLQISCRLEDNELLELSKEIAKNEMMVKIDKPPKKVPSNYEFCFRSNETLFLTFIQSSKLLYLPQSTTVMVANTMNFSFYSEGKSILEINECKSRAVTTVYHSFSTQDRANSLIKQVRKTNNIIEFNYYGPVYVQVEAKTSTIAWRKKDEVKKIGYGYDQYFPSKIRYEVEGSKLKVQVFPLRKSKLENVDVKFNELYYSAVVTFEEMGIYDALNCERGDFFVEHQSVKGEQPEIFFSFDINELLKSYSKKKYLFVGAMVNASSSVEGDGKYRFVYPYQEVPVSLLKKQVNFQGEGEEEEEKMGPIIDPKPIPQPNINPYPEQGWSVTKYLAVGVIIFFIGLVIYRVWVRKYLKKRRLQRLNQQGNQGEVRYQQFASYTS